MSARRIRGILTNILRLSRFNFSTLALLVAVAFAGILGDMNFWYNMQPFYDIENLNTYPNVNPTKEKGQQLMDAGRVYFTSGARLNNKSAAVEAGELV